MSKLFGYRYQKKDPTEAAATPVDELSNASDLQEPARVSTDTVGKTETFFSRNVKLITFLICLGVFLAIFGPISVFHIIDYVEEQNRGDVMPIADILALAEEHDTLRLSRFEGYEKEISKGKTTTYYFVSAANGYKVMAGAADEDSVVSYFTVTRSDTNESLDVLSSNFDMERLKAFLGASASN